MPVNHQYTAGTETYGGASEIVFYPTFHSSVKNLPGHSPIVFVRRGSLVTVTGLNGLDQTLPGQTILANLPSAFRPMDTVTLYGETDANEDRVFNVQSNGDFYNNTDSINQYFYLNATYFVG